MENLKLKKPLYVAVISFGWGLFSARAAAERVSYSFSGTDSQTGDAVGRTFSYQPDAPGLVFPGENNFADIKGSLSIALEGRTYTSDVVAAMLSPARMLVDNTDRPDRVALQISLAGIPGGSVSQPLAQLPRNLDAYQA